MKYVGEHINQWALDQSSTVFEFQVRHMVVTTVTGKFTKFSGMLRGDLGNITDAVIDLVIEGSSIDTHDRMRDKKLRGKNFFDVEGFPHIRFWSTGIERKDEQKIKVTGELKIKDVARQVTLNCDINEVATGVLEFNASGKVDSGDFGLKWKSFFDPGNVLVGSSVRISVKGRFKAEKQ